MSKGSRQRPGDKQRFDENFDRIFGKPTEKELVDAFESLPPSGFGYDVEKLADDMDKPDTKREYGLVPRFDDAD